MKIGGLNMLNEVSDESISVPHIRKFQCTTSIASVPLEFIKEKLMYMKVGDSSYIARLPNTVEVQ